MRDRENDGRGASTRSETTGLDYRPISIVPIERIEAGLSGPDSLDSDTDAPVALGRYRIGALIGEGGMGCVFEGYDRQLDRAVAIKVIRRGARPAAQQRLKREAEVMAKLAHPNVLTVLDVGEDGGEVFVVLERIFGRSLATWLEPARSTHDVLDRFLAAGDGLAAAHREGVVHGDFKPSNVLLADDGRVLLADFGLAQVARDDDDSTRGRAGTPRFMAPEVRRGSPPSKLSDQYSFGVALLEAVGGLLESGRPPRVPAGLRKRHPGLEPAISRMLAADPSRRFATVAEALDTLRRMPRRRRAAWILVPAAALPLVWLSTGVPTPIARCTADEVTAVEADATDLVTQARVTRIADLDDRGSALMTRAEQTECPKAVAEVGLAVGQAYARSARLELADLVLQRSFLAATEDGNDSARARSAVELATLHGVRRGEYESAQQWLRHAEAAAKAAAEPLLEAQVEQARGAVALRAANFGEAEEHLKRALVIGGEEADASFLGGTRANLAVALASQRRFDEALRELKDAAAALEAAPEHAASLVAVLTNRASMLRQVGRVPDAVLDYAEALEHAEALHGAMHPNVATLHVNLGQLALLAEQPQRAHHHMQTAVDIRTEILGSDDAQTARASHGLGQAELALGNLDAAEGAFVRAREVLALAPTDALSGYPEVGLAQIDLARGDADAALRRLGRVRPAIANGPWFSRADAYRTTARAHLASGQSLAALAFELAARLAYLQAGPAYGALAAESPFDDSTGSTGVGTSNL